MAASKATTLQLKWLEVFNKETEVFKFISKNQVFCLICEKSFISTQKSQLTQHTESSKHVRNCALKRKRKSTQANLEECFSTQKKKQKQGQYNEKGLSLV